MANEIRKVAKATNIVADLALIDNTYAEAIVYEDIPRTSGNVFMWRTSSSGLTVNNGTIYQSAGGGFWEMIFEEYVYVKWFGAKGDGSTDDTVEINAAASAAKNLHFGCASDHYIVSDRIYLNDGHWLSFDGATIQETAGHEIFYIANKTDITITGGNFIGLGTGVTGSEMGVYGPNSSRVTVTNCRFTNFFKAAILVNSAIEMNFTENIIVGPMNAPPTCAGILVDASSVRVYISGNSISNTGQGILTGDGCNDFRIIGNSINNITSEHGIYAGSGHVNLTIEGNTISTTGGHGIKVQNFDTAKVVRPAVNIVITGNTIYNSINHGIVVLNSYEGNTAYQRLYGVTISSNVIDTRQMMGDADGINVSHITGLVVSGNVIMNMPRNGIAFGNIENGIISTNSMMKCGQIGITEKFNEPDTIPSRHCIIRSNNIINCARDFVATYRFGIYIEFGSAFLIDDNYISDELGKMEYGILIFGGLQNDNVVSNNNIRLTLTPTYCAGIRFKNTNENLKFIGRNRITVPSTGANYHSLPSTLQKGDMCNVYWNATIPSTGTWNKGDIVYNTDPDPTEFIGWVCVTAGSPGTWKGFGEIDI